jgi:hypothetical protein
MHRLIENFELMSFGKRLFEKVRRSGLPGKEKNLAGGKIVRNLIAISIPVMPCMITSEISISGLNVGAISRAVSPL